MYNGSIYAQNLFVSCSVLFLATAMVIKGHLKKSDQVRNLVKKSTTKAFKTSDGEELPALPEQMKPLVQSIRTTLEEYKGKVSLGGSLIKDALTAMNEDDLKYMRTLFESSKAITKTEDKLTKVCSLFVPQIAQIQSIIPHLNHLKSELLVNFINAYAHEYNVDRGVDVIFDHDSFLQDVRDELSFRRGLKRGVRSSTEEQNAPVEEESEQTKNCSIM